SILRCGVQNYTQKQLHEILTAKNPLLEVPASQNLSCQEDAFYRRQPAFSNRDKMSRFHYPLFSAFL
ncbi:MAG: hypothetical protein JXD22_16790, partial [Sedimentisphaerales bacterium]|nr:hypothetical protein [Sedimentisphaerales bacterium]